MSSLDDSFLSGCSIYILALLPVTMFATSVFTVTWGQPPESLCPDVLVGNQILTSLFTNSIHWRLSSFHMKID